MRSREPVIRVEKLSKQYLIGGDRRGRETLRDVLATALSSPLRYFAPGHTATAEEKEFWALEDVSFEIFKGEIVGIIGRDRKSVV